MTDNVVELDTLTTLDIDPNKVIAAALDAGLEFSIVIGRKKDTGELYFASSLGDCAQVLWVLKKAEQNLLDISD